MNFLSFMLLSYSYFDDHDGFCWPTIRPSLRCYRDERSLNADEKTEFLGQAIREACQAGLHVQVMTNWGLWNPDRIRKGYPGATLQENADGSHSGWLHCPDNPDVYRCGRDESHLAVDIGERNVGNRPPQLAETADYIEAEFGAAGLVAKRQEYMVSDCNCCNLEVEVPGSARPEEIIIVGAHYDTVVGTPGANDNASGVAATLALARRFSRRQTDRTLRLVAFTNEEQPFAHTEQMGSRVYARRCRERGEQIVAMLSLETIGYYDDRPGSQKYPPTIGLLYPSEGNFIGFVGNLKSSDLVRQVVGIFRESEQFPSEGAALPELITRIRDSDHGSFWHEGYPALMVTDTANSRYCVSAVEDVKGGDGYAFRAFSSVDPLP